MEGTLLLKKFSESILFISLGKDFKGLSEKYFSQGDDELALICCDLSLAFYACAQEIMN